MIRVRVISKPVRPPWTDSSKNLVRDLVRWCGDTSFTLMGDGEYAPEWERVQWRRTYRGAGGYSPGLVQNGRVFFDLLIPDFRHQVDHFFFAPNPVTCRALRTLERVRRKPSVHTICSVPKTFDGIGRMLFADVQVALSQWTANRLEEEAVPMVRYIAPGIDPNLVEPDPGIDLGAALGLEGRPTVLFAGDYEVGGGAELLIRALPAILDAVPEAVLVLACRIKTEEARGLEAAVRRAAEETGVLDSVVFQNEVSAMANLLGVADVVTMPVTSTYRKMDVPLVLLEAMALSTPVVVSDLDPVRETVAHGGGLTVPGERPDALAEALVTVLSDADERKRLGNDAREAVERYWHIRHAAKRYERLYGELMGRPR